MVQSYSPGGGNVYSHEGTLAPPGEYNWTCASFGLPDFTTQTTVDRFSCFAQRTEECRRADWRYLANTIELVHPSAHSSPQRKRQSDRFSHFCIAHGRKCLSYTMGALSTRIAHSHVGIWTSI